ILETKVDYLMYDTNGYPFIGPGMQVQASFDGNGHVTRLLYAARQLEYGASVTAVPLDVASNRAAALFPPGTQLSLQTVYWCPPFQPVANTSSGWYPTNIIPWYLCHGSLNVTNPQTGLVSSSNLRARLIPATDDSAYVPSVSFSASAPNLTEVFASANVTGGTRPYTYNWAGSFSTVGQGSNTPALSYTPVTRFPPPSLQVLHPSPGVLTVYWQFHPLPGPGPDPGPDAWQLEFTTDLNLGPNGWTPVTNPVQSNDGVYSVDLATGNSPGFYRLRMVDSTLNTTENVSLTVTDANGISVNTNVTLNVIAQIVPAAKNAGVISYGTESPREPDFAVDRIGWQEGMGTSGGGGGSQSFCWMGDLAWPGDFIEPTPPGALMPTPWVNGDADYSNWGVNAASIVLNNTDGAPDYFASSEPGATIAEYATAELYHPGYPGGTVVINLDDWLDTATTHYYNINYDGSWGPIPPEDNLCWLLMDCCDVLDQNSSDGTAVERWSPAFGGLHILTGWNSEELLGDGSFEKNFAQDMLGIYGPAQTVLQAWFNAAHAAGASHGTPAAMGAFGPAYTSDYNDYYWGKGPVNATIPPWLVTGWWYIQDTLPASPPH
ncbi:MAG TPA: DUF6345 domain-containing protein, partial [Candidatus Acidoferrales bacterium]|nr:DUF6345 domain-containing protein [Candidatus Acidoferrales bacterium]